MMQESGPSAPLRLAVFTRQLLGLGEEKETAAPIASQVQSIASWGDHLTVVIIPQPGMDTAEHRERYDVVQQRYASRFQVEVRRLPLSDDLAPTADTDEAFSLHLLHFLQSSDFDAVWIDFEGGLAYFTLLAREMGVLDFRGRCYLLPHTPLAWRSASDRFFLENVDQIGIAFRERYCAERADGLIFTHQSMKDWMGEQGWSLPATVPVLPLTAPQEWRGKGVPSERPTPSMIGELVLFSDTGFRNGITLFCDAVDRLVQSGRPPGQITLLGAFDRVLGEHAGGMLLRRARRWPCRLSMLPGLPVLERLRYVEQNAALAVFSPLAAAFPMELAAALEWGLPLVATSVGGIPDMIREEDRERCLCRPEAGSLAERIASAMTSPPAPPRAAFDPDQARRDGLRFRDRITQPGGSIEQSPANTSTSARDAPTVSIVLVHHDRPALLRQALDSVRRQTYAPIELILVDDGSRLPESRSLLDSLESEFADRGWRILREPNRYLGAARNAGVRASRGEMILFLDDDNVLFPPAVETLVRAIQSTASDICTCFSRLLVNRDPPPPESEGRIQYLPLGGSLDLALFHNSIGDANALIRRDVFDRIGYLIEDYGYTCHDWEFFTRALLHSLKVRLLPLPLYWYRQEGRGMYRVSHWYDNRRPILDLLRRHDFVGMEHFVHPALASHVGAFDRESLHHNLYFHPEDEPFRALHAYPPGSNQAIECLAGIAESIGRPDTAEELRKLIVRTMEEEFALGLAVLRPILTDEDAGAAAVERGLKQAHFLHGHVENMESLPDGQIRIVGWVADTKPENPVPRVAFFRDGRLLGVAIPDKVRPDLATGFKAPHLAEVSAQFTFLAPAEPGAGNGFVAVAINRRGRFRVLTRS